MPWGLEMGGPEINKLLCPRCDYVWVPEGKPTECPRCHHRPKDWGGDFLDFDRYPRSLSLGGATPRLPTSEEAEE